MAHTEPTAKDMAPQETVTPLQLVERGGTQVPRRICLDLLTPVEHAIVAAVAAVERSGAHVRMTDAVILLGKAREAVADAIEAGVPTAPADIPQAVIDRVVAFMCDRENIPLDALNAEQQENLRAEAADLIRAVHGAQAGA